MKLALKGFSVLTRCIFYTSLLKKIVYYLYHILFNTDVGMLLDTLEGKEGCDKGMYGGF